MSAKLERASRQQLIPIVGILEAVNYFSDGRITIPELADALDSVLDFETVTIYRGDVEGLPFVVENTDSWPLPPGEIRACDVAAEIFHSRFWVDPNAIIIFDTKPSDFLVTEVDGGTIALLLWKFFLGGEEPEFWDRTLSDFAHGHRETFVGIDDWRSGGNSLKEELDAERKKTAELAAQVEQLKAQANFGFLDPDHPRRSDKLAAAVLAWQALEDESLRCGKRAYSAAEDWLKARSVELGLVHKRDNKRNNTKAGDVNGTAIEEVAKVVNWELDGGAPRTPGG